MRARWKQLIAALTLLAVVTPVHAQTAVGSGQEYNGEFRRVQRPPSTDRIIVRWAVTATAASARRKASVSPGLEVIARQPLDTQTEVLQLQQRLAGDALDTAVRQLQSNPDVAFAAPDLRRHAHAVTNDPLLTEQWYLLSAQPAATRSEQAWDVTTGSPGIVVAVLDTGVRFEHPDLSSKVLAGYDMVNRPEFANDGDGRDADASDPGDWVDANDRSQPAFSDCDVTSSSWHGTRVAGLIGALTNNATGVAGAAWDTRVLPVRVLGKCGGFDSDILAGMRWAAGLSVAGVPDNPTPAFINMSLGGDGVCTAAYQSTVDEIIARGVMIVASVGNDGGPVGAPANCNGVLGVAGIRHIGTKVGFSNLGTETGLGAPGGNCVNTGPGQPCLFSILVATNSGATTPAASTFTDQIDRNVGTSFSAPLAAAAAALMRSINDRLSPSQLITLLKRTAAVYTVSPDPAIPICHVPTGSNDVQNTECNCTTQTCGAGMLDSGAAVRAAQRPFAILETTGTLTIGSSITIDGQTSFASNGRTVVSYAWTVQDLTGSAPVIAAPAEANTTLQVGGASEFTLRLTVTDDQGAQDTQEIVLATPIATPPPPPPPAPAPPSSPATTPRRGGGGGSFGSELVVIGLLVGWSVYGRNRRTARARQPH
jgi:serine protease